MELHKTDERVRLAVTVTGDEHVTLSNAASTKHGEGGYVAQPGERVEWVLPANSTLHGVTASGEDPEVSIDELDERGPKG